jgi:hypothetical protein
MKAAISENAIAFAATVNPSFCGTIQEDVIFDGEPDGVDDWESGDEMPDQVLGESESKSGYYRLFKYARDIIGSGFRPTGKNYGGCYDDYPR